MMIILHSCAPENYSFKKNIDVKGYVIYTTMGLVNNKGELIGPAPSIMYYFVRQKDIVKARFGTEVRNGASLYELNIHQDELREWYSNGGDTLFFEASGGFIEHSFIFPAKLLIKKEFNIKSYNLYDQPGYRICLNGRDTIDIRMNYGFMLVNDLSPY